MSENKRYWYDFEDSHGAKFVDFETGKEYACETVGDFQEIEDLLNDKDAEITRLKKELKKS